MNEDEYKERLLEFYPDRGHDAAMRLAECAMGLGGETGEAVDLLKKHLIYGRPLEREALIAEMGDVLNYLTKLSHEIGVDMAEIRERNINKLWARTQKQPGYFGGK